MRSRNADARLRIAACSFALFFRRVMPANGQAAMTSKSWIRWLGAGLIALALIVAPPTPMVHAVQDAHKVSVMSFGLFGDQGVFSSEATGAAQVVAGRFGRGPINVQYISKKGGRWCSFCLFAQRKVQTRAVVLRSERGDAGFRPNDQSRDHGAIDAGDRRRAIAHFVRRLDRMICSINVAAVTRLRAT